jgi:hypothetical protein
VQQAQGRVAPASLPPGEGDRIVINGQLQGDPPISPDPGSDTSSAP